MANVDLNVYIIAHEILFKPCIISRGHNGARPGIGQCYHIQIPTGKSPSRNAAV